MPPVLLHPGALVDTRTNSGRYPVRLGNADLDLSNNNALLQGQKSKLPEAICKASAPCFNCFNTTCLKYLGVPKSQVFLSFVNKNIGPYIKAKTAAKSSRCCISLSLKKLGITSYQAMSDEFGC